MKDKQERTAKPDTHPDSGGFGDTHDPTPFGFGDTNDPTPFEPGLRSKVESATRLI